MKTATKTAAHQRYRSKILKLKNGKGAIFPGVTTILGNVGWGKEFLVRWANRLGLKGIDSTKYRDDTADIGTLGHALVTNAILGIETDTSDYTKNQIEQAENVALSYFEWEKGHTIELIYDGDKPMVEVQLVSEEYQYGGQIDIYALVDGVRELLDIKTGGVWDTHYVQVGGGYHGLLTENGFPVERVRILNLPRTEDEKFKDIIVTNIDACWEAFECARKLHDLHKKFR